MKVYENDRCEGNSERCISQKGGDGMEAVSAKQQDIELKLLRVRNLLQQHQYTALYIQRKDNFAWLTSGGYNGIPYNSLIGACGLLITSTRAYLLTDAIEKPRILQEELLCDMFEVIEYPWYHDVDVVLHQLIPSGSLASDCALATMPHELVNIAPLRFLLTNLEVERLRYLGRGAAELLEALCQEITPGMTELEIEGELNKRYIQRGFQPTVTLVGADERIDLYRHPVPTMKQWQRKCMVVSCVRYRGLIVALTRIIHQGKMPAELKEKHVQTAWIEAEMIAQTRQGTELRQLFQTMCDAYEQVGYPSEWKLHHQGGAIGYENRDYILTPTSLGQVEQYQPFAWNPSITGTKSEDTIIAGEEGGEILTWGSSWPMLDVQVSTGKVIQRPNILEC